MRTIVRSTAQTLMALALTLMLPNTASAACDGFADVPEDAACYPCGAAAPAADQTQARQPSYISMAQAQMTALDAANIDAASADISSSTLDEVAGVSCYKVEFTAGGRAYDYSINAETGAVLEMSVHDEAAAPADAPQTDAPVSGTATAPASGTATAPSSGSSHAASASVQAAPNTNASAGKVDEARAKEIALNHAGVKAADATVTKSKLDYDDGRQVYEIEFYVSGSNGYTEYDYEIEAATGKIVSYDYDAESYTPSQSTNTNANVKISEATAKQTALARVPGATAANIYKFKLDFDDGRWEYEGEIRYGTMEYDFTIDANTGAVTEWDAESVYD